MDIVYGDGNYHLRVEQPDIVLDHDLYPKLPHVLAQVKISLLVERRFLGYLPDGSTTDPVTCLDSVKERSCTLVLRDFFENLRGTSKTLSETLSSLEIDQQYFNQIIDTIMAYGRIMYNCVANNGQNALPMNVSITKKQDVYVHYDRYLMDMAMRESEAEFERTNYGMVPASKPALETLLRRVKIEGENRPRKKRRTSEESRQNCTICLQKLAIGSNAISMPCSHLFHHRCIFRWLKQSHYCPVCRYEMPT
ncbi:RING/U-box superfamily protein [Melia azedarach]|uniref:RING/U-box superfamily protein n=1 Tax=Melia azedarach TaxID=155640 RepID=A0ACC1XJ84_MELAZ|nr:RING/U-box superfamily protein [Melia azedarach]